MWSWDRVRGKLLTQDKEREGLLYFKVTVAIVKADQKS